VDRRQAGPDVMGVYRGNSVFVILVVFSHV